MSFILLSLSTHADGARAAGAGCTSGAVEDIFVPLPAARKLCYLCTQLCGGLISLRSAGPCLWTHPLPPCNTPTSRCTSRSAGSRGGSEASSVNGECEQTEPSLSRADWRSAACSSDCCFSGQRLLGIFMGRNGPEPIGTF